MDMRCVCGVVEYTKGCKREGARVRGCVGVCAERGGDANPVVPVYFAETSLVAEGVLKPPNALTSSTVAGGYVALETDLTSAKSVEKEMRAGR